MALIRCVRGEVVDAEVFMVDANGVPAVGTEAPSWVIRAPDQTLVIGGFGTQDVSDASHWEASFSIPLSAPLALNGSKYQITWTMPLQSGGSQRAVERFEVVPEGDPIRPVNQTDQLVSAGSLFKDSLYLPTLPILGTMHFAIKDVNGTIIYEKGDIQSNAPTRQFTDTYAWDIVSNQRVETNTSNYGGFGFAPFFGEWNYKLPGEPPSTEFHAIYSVDMKMIMLMNSLQKLIDRAHLGDIHPDLAFTDIDLAHYIIRGIEYVNASPPNQTMFNAINLPPSFVDPVIKAAAVEAMSAQFLAEGMKAFNFQGLAVQLDVDRTNYISSMRDMMANQLDSQLRTQKRVWIRGGGFSGNAAGAMSVSVGSFTNFIYNAGDFWTGLSPYSRGIAFLALRSIGQ